MVRAALALAVLLASIGNPAWAEEPLIVEETFLTVEIKGELYQLEALVAREAGVQGKLPIAIITHGQTADVARRERTEARSMQRVAREFARRGWLAAVVVRRGFGRSEGKQFYALPGCRNGDYGSMLDDQTDDIEAAIKAVGKRRDADASHVIAFGYSVGGAIVLNLAARKPEGLRAAINVAGGGRPRTAEGVPLAACKPEDLVPFFARLGERSRLPTLWVYAENDSFFPADYVRDLHEAYVAKGGRTQFHMFDAIGEDGHGMLGNADGLLRIIPALDRFLRSNRLRTYDPSAITALVDTLKPSHAARRVFLRYHGRPTEKALGVSTSNKVAYAHFGGDDLAEMERKALQECAERANEPCRIVLRNFEVVDEPSAR